MIFQWVRRSLTVKIVLACTIVEVIMLCLLLFNSVRLLNQATYDHAQTHLKEIPPLINTSVAPLVFQRDFASINDFLNDLFVDDEHGIKHIIIQDNSGQIYGKKGNINKESVPSLSNNLQDSIKTPFLHFEIPLQISNKQVGLVKYGISLKHLIETKNKLLYQGVLIASVEILVTICLLGLLGYILTGHIRTLVTKAKAMSKGDYNIATKTPGVDEIGVLSKNFDEMAIKIKEQNRDLRESQYYFSQIFEQSSTSMCLYNPDGTINRVNDEFCKLFGVEEKDIKNFGYNVFKDQAVRDTGIIPLLKEVFDGKKNRKWEINFDIDVASTSTNTPVSKKGKVYIEVYGHPILNNNQELEYVVLQHRDITERKKAEEVVRERESQYNAIVENSGDYIIRYDKEHRHIWANQGAIKSTGLPPEQFLGKTHREMNFPEHLCELWEKNINEVFATGEIRRVEFDVELEKGLMTLDLQFNPEINEEGKVLSVIGVSRDITYKKMEEKRYKKTIESSFDGFWVVDINGNFLEVNEAYSNMIGYSRVELLRMSINSVEAAENRKETKNRIEKIIRNGRDQFESKHRHKKGHIIDVEVSAAYTPDNDGLFFVFLRDITERNQMEMQLRQAQKMESIGTLAGGIAHDFNNILYPIIGFTQLSQSELPKEHPVQENLTDILDGSLRARDLVKRILLFSRQKEQELKPVILQSVIKESLKLLRSTIPANIEITLDLYNGEDYVLCDTSEIHEIILNLCTNAYHAIVKNKGNIIISLNKQNPFPNSNLPTGEYLCFSVKDNGVGIPENIRDKIFEPYVTTKDVGKGSGLGLSVVYGIVKNYKGDISIESDSVQGTKIAIFLPISKETNYKDVIENDTFEKKGTERILFVDDEGAIVKLGVRALKNCGYHVTGVQDSTEALEQFKSMPEGFDLVITDMAMPGMVGSELSQKILKIRPDIPIIICSGYSEKLEKEKLNDLKVSAFLDKPLSVDILAKITREVLDQKKTE